MPKYEKSYSKKNNMYSLITIIQSVAISLCLVMLFLPDNALGFSETAQCHDIADRGYINILTLNMLLYEIEDRSTRVENLKDFISGQSEAGDPIDIILLQEVVGGLISGTDNSSEDLQSLLKANGLDYDLIYQQVHGIKGMLTEGNAILSRCEIQFALTITLPAVTEEPFKDYTLILQQKALMSRIKIPHYGKINVYNTHLCAYCDHTERLEQTSVLLKNINDLEFLIFWDSNPVILGGDFNINLNDPDSSTAYELITENYSFIDTYGAFNLCTNCCSEFDDYAGCTCGVEGNPYANMPPFTCQSGNPERLDYIFIKGNGIDIDRSSVVFSNDTWISDHSGVLTRIYLPAR